MEARKVRKQPRRQQKSKGEQPQPGAALSPPRAPPSMPTPAGVGACMSGADRVGEGGVGGVSGISGIL